MLLAELVATSAAVAATRSRTAKIAALASCIAGLPPDEIEAGVSFLSGQARQGRIGVGWATLSGFDRGDGASVATITVGQVDAWIDRLAAVSGPGSAGARAQLLREL